MTAISFTYDRDENLVCLVLGDEDGLISFHVFTLKDGLSLQKSWDMEELSTAKAVTRVQWRPKLQGETSEAPARLAVAAADGSVRILTVHWVKAYLESVASQSQ